MSAFGTHPTLRCAASSLVANRNHSGHCADAHFGCRAYLTTSSAPCDRRPCLLAAPSKEMAAGCRRCNTTDRLGALDRPGQRLAPSPIRG